MTVHIAEEQKLYRGQEQKVLCSMLMCRDVERDARNVSTTSICGSMFKNALSQKVAGVRDSEGCLRHDSLGIVSIMLVCSRRAWREENSKETR